MKKYSLFFYPKISVLDIIPSRMVYYKLKFPYNNTWKITYIQDLTFLGNYMWSNSGRLNAIFIEIKF